MHLCLAVWPSAPPQSRWYSSLHVGLSSPDGWRSPGTGTRPRTTAANQKAEMCIPHPPGEGLGVDIMWVSPNRTPTTPSLLFCGDDGYSSSTTSLLPHIFSLSLLSLSISFNLSLSLSIALCVCYIASAETVRHNIGWPILEPFRMNNKAFIVQGRERQKEREKEDFIYTKRKRQNFRD